MLEDLGRHYRNARLNATVDRGFRVGPMGKFGNLRCGRAGSPPARLPNLWNRFIINLIAFTTAIMGSSSAHPEAEARAQRNRAYKYIGDICGRICAVGITDTEEIKRGVGKLMGLDFLAMHFSGIDDFVEEHVRKMRPGDCPVLLDQSKWMLGWAGAGVLSDELNTFLSSLLKKIEIRVADLQSRAGLPAADGTEIKRQ